MDEYWDFATFHRRLRLQTTLTLKTALRVGAGGSESVVGAEIPVVRDGRGRPFIPGSSFKGALRVTVERLARTIKTQKVWACPNPLDLKDPKKGTCVTKKRKDDLRDEATSGGQIDEEAFTRKLAAKTCPVCRLFGSPWLAGKLHVKDLPLVEESWVGHVEMRYGVGIDRDTRTAASRLLYTFEAVPAGAEFECEIVLENADDTEIGLALLGLREMQQGRLPLGGARSRGLGWATLDKWQKVEWVDEKNLLDYLFEGKVGSPPQPLDDYIKALRAT